MLFFEGNKIIFNTEVGIKANYKLTRFPYANPQYLKEFLPKCDLYEKVKASEIKNSGQIFGMSAGKEFLAFMISWLVNVMQNSDFYMSEEDFKSWIESYFECLIDFDKEFGEHTSDIPFFPDFLLTKMDLNILQDLKLDRSPIEIDYPVQPEISWSIVDCWKRIQSGQEEKFPFENQVNQYILENIKRLKFWTNRVNYFGEQIVTPHIRLKGDINLRNINYSNPYSFYYFYCPTCNEPIRTNYLYLQKLWKEIFN